MRAGTLQLGGKRPLTDQPVAGSAKRLSSWSSSIFSVDRLRNSSAVATRDFWCHVGPHIFWRQPDVMTVNREHASQMMGAAAGLHPDDARRKLLRQSNQCLAPHPTPHHDRAGRVEPNDAADVLAEVDPQGPQYPFLSSF